MVYFIGTYTIATGPVGNEIGKKTIEWTKKLVKYMQERWPEWDVKLLRNYEGAQGEIHFFARHESIAAREAAVKEFNQDERVKGLFEELNSMQQAAGGQQFLTNSRHRYYRIVDVD